MVKVEQFGSRQKRTCFGCGSVISFENNDIIKGTGNITYVECPVCGKHIKAMKVDRENEFYKNNPTNEDLTADSNTTLGKKIGEALGD